MKRFQHSFWLGLMAMALAGSAALAQEADPLAPGSDQLASTIEQSLKSVEFQLTVAPESAAKDLEAQRRRLAILETEDPDHPMLPELTRRIEELEAETEAALGEGEAGAEGGTVERSGLILPVEPPPEVGSKMREIENLQTRADRELMRGEHESAEHYLEEARSAIDEVEEAYGDQIPPGYAALIVAKERLAALRDQLADTRAAD